MKRNIAIGFDDIKGHQASTEDIGIIMDAAKALYRVGLCPDGDVIYIADILNTLILLDTFASSNGSDSQIAAILKRSIVS